jgi:hypothetical protein
MIARKGAYARRSVGAADDLQRISAESLELPHRAASLLRNTLREPDSVVEGREHDAGHANADPDIADLARTHLTQADTAPVRSQHGSASCEPSRSESQLAGLAGLSTGTPTPTR